MALYFVRHGETDWNAEKRFQSITDVPLNARGLAQAQCCAEELQRRGVHITELRCSPLSRAHVTAQIIGSALSLEPVVDTRLMEMNFGEWEGWLEPELSRQFGGDFDVWRQSHYTQRPPGGEALIDVAERLSSLRDELLHAAIAADVMVVAHQAIMMALKALLTGDYSVDAARSYKQNNDEVDVWTLDPPRRTGFFQCKCDEREV